MPGLIPASAGGVSRFAGMNRLTDDFQLVGVFDAAKLADDRVKCDERDRLNDHARRHASSFNAEVLAFQFSQHFAR